MYDDNSEITVFYNVPIHLKNFDYAKNDYMYVTP